MSRFNELLHGDPAHAAVLLDCDACRLEDSALNKPSEDDVRVALVNALNRIASLEKAVAELAASDRLHHGRYR